MKIFVLMALGILILGGCSTLTPTDQNLKVCQSKEDKISGCIAKTMLEGGRVLRSVIQKWRKSGGGKDIV